MSRFRFTGWRVLAALAMTLAAAAVAAQDYPTKLIRIILPFSPGSSTDIYSRIIARELQLAWGQSVIIENRPGATGVIGTEFVRQAAPDGYTLLFTTNTAHVLGPLLRDPPPFDAADDFTPITKIVSFSLYLVVHPSIPVRTLNEFIAFGKAKRGQLIYASSGQGGVSHVVTELFNSAAGIKATHVPYKGAAPALNAVVAGETHYLFNNIGVAQPQVLAGRLRGLAVTGDKRSPALPQMPTIAEAGIRGLENAYTWLGILGSAKMPAPVLVKLNTEIVRIMRTPEVEKRVINDGYVLVANTPAEFKNEVKLEIAIWSKVVRERGIKAE